MSKTGGRHGPMSSAFNFPNVQNPILMRLISKEIESAILSKNPYFAGFSFSFSFLSLGVEETPGFALLAQIGTSVISTNNSSMNRTIGLVFSDIIVAFTLNVLIISLEILMAGFPA